MYIGQKLNLFKNRKSLKYTIYQLRHICLTTLIKMKYIFSLKIKLSFQNKCNFYYMPLKDKRLKGRIIQMK